MVVSWMRFSPSGKVGGGFPRYWRSKARMETNAAVPRQNVKISHRQCRIGLRDARRSCPLLSCASRRGSSVALAGSRLCTLRFAGLDMISTPFQCRRLSQTYKHVYDPTLTKGSCKFSPLSCIVVVYRFTKDTRAESAPR
jgi:hypothetical protein